LFLVVAVGKVISGFRPRNSGNRSGP
jgi:hypothetical protein